MHKEKHTDIYQLVTNRIIEHLEKGMIPWRKPWHGAGAPRNLVTDKPYRGVNVLLLASLGYEQNYFLTFRQVKELGGSIRKEEKSSLVIFWKWKEYKNEETGKTEKIPILRYYRVFNIAQCEDIPKEKLPEKVERKHDPIQSCEQIIDGMPNRPNIQHGGDRAYYHPKQDYVNMPKPESFIDPESYYGTLFHELVHSTGHQSRLNRKELVETTSFGSEKYSTEELTAEIGASFLKSHAGIPIEELENSAAYIQHWLEVLKNDRRFIVYASAHAQKAADYVMNVRQIEKEIELPETPEALPNPYQAGKEEELNQSRKNKSQHERSR